MLYLLIYLIVGVVLAFVMATIHFIKARKLGYEIDTINTVAKEYNRSKLSILGFIIGLLLWPIRLVLFKKTEYELMFLYNLKTLEEMENGSY